LDYTLAGQRLLLHARAGLAGRATSVVSGAGEPGRAGLLRAEAGRLDHLLVVALSSDDG